MKLMKHIEKNATLYALAGFLMGIAFALLFSATRFLAWFLNLIVDSYAVAAPVVIFLILAPSLIKPFRYKKSPQARFAGYVLLWFSGMRLLACLFAIMCVGLVYSLPLWHHNESVSGLYVLDALKSLATMMTGSIYFFTIYFSVFTAFVLSRIEAPWVERFSRLPDVVESFGSMLTHVVPLFTFLVGIYVTTLPGLLAENFATYPAETFSPVSVFGFDLAMHNAEGILFLYVILAFLTGLVSTIWHACMLFYVRWKIAAFSIKRYFSDYFFHVYPLLWATSSEALSTPLNLHLIKKNYPQIHNFVHQMSITFGSVFNINGTLTCCFVMIPPVCMMLGIQVSVLDLLLCLIVIYFIGFGVPGLPGELILFAGPIMSTLNIPEPLTPAFLLIFISMQVGLPDSFRTGANSTDDCPSALILNRIYARQTQAAIDQQKDDHNNDKISTAGH